MRFCPNCHRVMARNPTSGSVVFECPCGVEEKGEPGAARVAGAILGASETTEMYRRLVQTAPHDRTNQLVRRNCPDCGLDYMVQLRVGDEVILYKCKCGFEGGNDVPAAAPPP
jgi:DNA-directed RNA polymerase subunit M/transcription elongation factor TFIIS